MNENSPICARLAEIVKALATGCRNASMIRKAAADFPITMMNSVQSTGSGSRTTLIGSNSIPTETKNKTAKASRNGSDSSAAR